MVSGSPTKLAYHDNEEDSAPIQAAEPANLPIVDAIAE
jgi:hypothetical protein